jgi:ankyrin repeat protein
LEVLRYCFPPSVRRILEELPESLDETYERILREIRKSNQEHARRLLQCLVAAVRPLLVEELAEVVAVDFDAGGIPKLNPAWRWEDQEEAVMSACSSLVIVVNEGSSRVVQFSHFSVKEYLTSDRLADPSRDVSRYHILLEPAHTVLAQACLGVLLRLDDRTDVVKIKSFPLARYAVHHWIKHARFANVSSHIKNAMECLFDADKPHLAAWLWLNNEDRPDCRHTTFPEKLEANPLYYAARFGLRDLTAHLLAKHPKAVRAWGGYEMTPLHASAVHGDVDTFSLLVDHFPNPDIRGRWRQTPLHGVSSRGHLEIGRRLLDRGADVNAQELDGWTPLYIAARNGQLEFARMLLQRGAAINSPSRSGCTPLHAAAEYGHRDVARYLLEHGADPNARGMEGRTPWETATRHQRREIVQLLSEYSTESVTE